MNEESLITLVTKKIDAIVNRKECLHLKKDKKVDEMREFKIENVGIM